MYVYRTIKLLCVVTYVQFLNLTNFVKNYIINIFFLFFRRCDYQARLRVYGLNLCSARCDQCNVNL